jgi:hypothetical protein
MKDEPPTLPWVGTGLRVKAGERLRIASEPHGHPTIHRVCYGGSNGCWDADGNGQPAPGGWTAPGLPQFSLIGRIGNGAPFYVGPNYDVPAPASGDLTLGLNDCTGCFGDNTVENGSVSYSFNIWIDHTAGTQFAVGDRVLVVQMTGPDAGRQEVATVAGLGSSALTLTVPLENTYTTNGSLKAQVLRMPQYRSVTVQPDGILTARQWDGTSGGILAFTVQTQLDVAAGGRIVTSAGGFRGGPGRPWDQPNAGPGWPGESYLGLPPTPSRSPNAGGGGGGQNAGGGGGGYAVDGEPGAEDYPGLPYGYGGLSYGVPEVDLLYLGSGGGGGGHVYGDAANGGNGSGAAFIMARTMQIAGTIEGNGQGGGQADYTGNFAPDPPVGDGRAGGGGSGGSIRLIGDMVALGTNGVQALGGPKGQSIDGSGFGGDGAIGRIRVEYCSALTGTTNPPASTLEIACPPLRFHDVPLGDSFYPYIQWLTTHNILSGYPDGTFRPGNPTTRGQFSKVLVRAFDWPVVSRGPLTFADVPLDHTYYPFVEALREHGIVSGYLCGRPEEPCDGQQRPYFRPNNPITRGQLAKILVRARGWSPDNNLGPSFGDVAETSPFYPYIELCVQHGLLTGYPCGGVGEPCDAQRHPYFRVNASATRGQMSKLIYLAVAPP